MQYSTLSKVWLSLGSNTGDRLHSLRAALEAIGNLAGTTVNTVSSVYETEPWGETDQATFYNIAVEIGTAFEPLELLNTVKLIETRLGRIPGPHWGPRIIDIDIILWKDCIVATPELTIPHPHYAARAFVLIPMNEIAPSCVDSITGMSIDTLAAQVEGKEGVRKVMTSESLMESTTEN
ncbi:MAG: 2-amino-4-hydroxy-6-hydroxymethyldihydropteridine diphosphokinase [Candidatus Hydrogenedentota bacterium]